jgi:hypothetical protein
MGSTTIYDKALTTSEGESLGCLGEKSILWGAEATMYTLIFI